MTLLMSALPLIIACKVAFVASGTIIGVDAIAPLEQTKDNRLSKGPSAPPPPNTSRAKV